jgi:nitroimidazol reductase NimA-like FMN-containing flavoprotein (pyridoxamine 5'-phosphate oxidase superfamily)
MRRKEQEITDRTTLESILQRATVCRLGLAVGDEPYVVPVSFGYRDGCLYVHSSPEGKKVEMIRQNPRVCFEVDVDEELVRKGAPCAWSVRYRSVIGWGQAAFITAEEEKRRALDVIVTHYGAEPGAYTDKALREVAVIRVQVEEMTGKKSGF